MRVDRREEESFEQFLGRYKKVLTRSGILREVKQRRFYLSPSESRRAKEKVAERRRRRRQRRSPS